MSNSRTQISLKFRPILESDKVQDFDCGVDSLNRFLKDFAYVNQTRRLSVTIVAYQQTKLIGYYSLSPAQIDSETLPKKFARSLPKYPLPAFRLCRLAVDMHHQKMKCGSELLVHALMKCYQQSTEIGGYCVIVDAINDKAKIFYEKFGFYPLTGDSNTLFMPMKSIQSYHEMTATIHEQTK